MDTRSQIRQRQSQLTLGRDGGKRRTSPSSFDDAVPENFAHSSRRSEIEGCEPRTITPAMRKAPTNTAYYTPTASGATFEYTSTSSGATRSRQSNNRSQAMEYLNDTALPKCAPKQDLNQQDHQRAGTAIATDCDTARTPYTGASSNLVVPLMDSSITKDHSLQFSTDFPGVQEAKYCGSDLVRFLENHEAQFAQYSCIISCLATCFRPLHKSTIQFAVARNLMLKNSVSSGPSVDTSAIRIDTSPESIFQEDGQGFLTFRNPRMRGFFHHFVIDDIDATHATLAATCRSVLDEQLTENDTDVTMAPGQADFISYAREYKDLHEKEDESTYRRFVSDSIEGPSNEVTLSAKEETKD